MKWAPQHLVKEMTLGSKEVAWISVCCHQTKHSTYHAMILDSRLDDSTIILQNDMDWERHRPPCKDMQCFIYYRKWKCATTCNDQVWLASVPMIGPRSETNDIVFTAAQQTKGLTIQWSWSVQFHPGEQLPQVSEACRTSQLRSYTLNRNQVQVGIMSHWAKAYLTCTFRWLYNKTLRCIL